MVELAQKPRLRGVSHQIAFFVFLVATTWLSLSVRGGSARVAVAVYGASICFLLGTSALYHRGRWSEAAVRWIQRVDHSAIFVLIAGSYTPLFILLAPESERGPALALVWLLAAVGVVKALVWPRSPGWVTAVLAIGVGWCGVMQVSALSSAMGPAAFVLIVAAGVVYTLGGLVYATRRPDPRPTVFGYHEVFHAFVIAAGSAHFAHVVLVLDRAGAFQAAA
ncbi:MAG: hemolysin III family protein [Myxococcales bacterium]|nr:hemolysin III family protein [Myxococcales bacterium]